MPGCLARLPRGRLLLLHRDRFDMTRKEQRLARCKQGKISTAISMGSARDDNDEEPPLRASESCPQLSSLIILNNPVPGKGAVWNPQVCWGSAT